MYLVAFMCMYLVFLWGMSNVNRCVKHDLQTLEFCVETNVKLFWMCFFAAIFYDNISTIFFCMFFACISIYTGDVFTF